ncbi:cupin domain-containing protein [Allonocardiopsis opalescens]|uniref:Cupin superfamily protein n=1 Tax=Allonocardiopsis opalescens TaxID=1144618 RepID=A0A2T0QCA7_9ACTN|nr:cupin domain-containing protein [Allonocardiopsis opalescens]PRY01586.1 Cupin superfamily protein [Allonocardiopsis opalescens]
MTAELISGRLGGEEFLTRVLGRAHAHYPAADRQAFTHLLTWSDLNRLLAAHRLDTPRMRLSAGSTIDVAAYTQRQAYRRMPDWNRPVPQLVHERLRAGATLVLDAIDEMHPPINDTAAGLEAWLGTRVQVNAYASWTAQEGFGLHWDDHDVIVVQVAGRKRWRIHGITRVAPLHSDLEFDNGVAPDPIDELTMEAGDILHVPRGCWHAAAASEGEPSLHLTCGLNTTTGADFLAWITDQMRAHVEVRSDVPRDRADQTAWTSTLAELVTKRLQQPDVVEDYRRFLDETAPARQAFSLPVAVTGELTLASRVRLASPRGRLHQAETEVVLAGQGRRWRMAAGAAPAIARLADGRTATVEELRGAVPDVSERALLGLLRRLLEDGALVWEGEA